MRIVSLFAFCFALAACTEEEVVAVLEPVDFDIPLDAGVVSPTLIPSDSVSQ